MNKKQYIIINELGGCERFAKQVKDEDICEWEE